MKKLIKKVWVLGISYVLCLAMLQGEGEKVTPFARAREKIERMIAFNDEFVKSRTRVDFADYLKSQSPTLTVVMCSDSRVQPPSLHDSPEGHLFTIRNIGNQIASNEGSADYGVKVLKTPLLMILGHTDCGAVQAALKGYANLDASIQDELDTIDIGDAKDEKQALINNVNSQIEIALEKYRSLVDDKQLFIVGGIYDIQNIFGHGHGALVFTNVNGSTTRAQINKHALFEGIQKAKILDLLKTG